MTSPKTVRDAILTLLQTADPQNGKEDKIKKWFKTQLKQASWPSSPFAWVEYGGGPLKPGISTRSEVQDKFYVVVIDQHAKEEVAEDSVLDFADSIKTALATDMTLGGTVLRSWVSNREKEKLFEKDYSLVGVRLTVETRRYE